MTDQEKGNQILLWLVSKYALELKLTPQEVVDDFKEIGKEEGQPSEMQKFSLEVVFIILDETKKAIQEGMQ